MLSGAPPFIPYSKCRITGLLYIISKTEINWLAFYLKNIVRILQIISKTLVGLLHHISKTLIRI